MPLLRLLLVGLVALLLGAPAAALAQDAPFGIGTITDNLEATGVAIDPDADVPEAQAARYRDMADRLRAEGVPVDVVVLGRQALGAATFADELHRSRNYNGIQVVIVQEPRGISFAAPAVYAFQDEHEGLVERATGILPRDPVRAAEALAVQGWDYSERETAAYADRTSGSDDDESAARQAGRVVGVILVLALIVAIPFIARRVRRTRQQGASAGAGGWGSRARAMPDAVNPHEALDGLLDDLANRITDLASDVDRPEVPEAARRAYTEAVLAFGEARDALPKATTTRRARTVQNDIERGLHAAEAARRIIDGDPPSGNGRRGRGS